jgi:hypothetical protein
VSDGVTALGGPGRLRKKMRPELKRTFARVLGSALCALLALGLGQSSALAGSWDYWDYLEWSSDGARKVLARGADAVLYELSENAFVEFDANGNPVARGAESSLQGVAKLGTVLCPSSLLVTNPTSVACTVTVRGKNFVSLTTGQGPITGEFAIVIQLDNQIDSPELPVVLGDFQGTIDFAPALMGQSFGTAAGTLTVKQSFVPGVPVNVTVPFTGVFRQPFALSLTGKHKKPARGELSFYNVLGWPELVKQDEKAANWPTVRFEIKFGQ